MLHSLWRRWNSRPESLIPPELIENHRESISLSFVEQKIHPNLNALADEMSSQGYEYMSESGQNDQGHIESLEAERVDFVGLQPSTRRPLTQKEKDHSSLIAHQNQIKDPELSQGLLYDNVQEFQRERSNALLYDIPHNSSSAADRVQRIGHSMSTSITRWSTFGRRTERKHAPAHPTGPGAKVRSASKSGSQSSLSQPQSHTNSPSRLTSSDTQPRTPGSSTTQSFHTSTPHLRGNLSRSLARDSILPSPNTFGARTPMQSTSESKHGGSYFDFKEIPPPLPPLDHPAFKAQKESTIPPGQQGPGFGQFIRHATHSLPSLTGSRASPISAKKKNARPRSKSTVENVEVSLRMSSGKVLHSRSQSKSSIASSRRSSAEYSAKQASSIGHESTGDGGWEIQVSKAMISLALGEGGQGFETKSRRAHHSPPPSSFGTARGKNWSSGGVSRLGSPFLLQDSYTHKLTDDHLFDPTAINSRGSGRKSSEIISRSPLRNNVMSHGDSMTPPTSSSANTARKGKENSGEGSPSPSGSYSPKGGRTLSSPSRTQTPSPPPSKLNTSTILGNAQGSSSLLQPPTLSVIAPTPEASPVSPTRRTHHKSTPTMPTASVLRTPSVPTVIEKSYSSGSGKRKAEEAGVSGDKTPPKERREPRATFAPDPRTHRTSATSGSSVHAPSSFNRSKRVRLSEASEGRSSTRSASHVGSLSLPTPNESPPNAKSTGSWSSKGSHDPLSESSHTRGYGPPSAPSASQASHYNAQQQLPPSRRSLSQTSIPISALISPHAPSIGRTGTFHMRDPRKPSPIQSTPWSLSFPSQVRTGEAKWGWRGWVERGGSPLHSWLFFIGFILFPLWWIAAFLPIPRTRRLGGTDAEKAVTLDDPQVEHDAKSWRIRCRFMAAVSLVTYIPFIVLVAVYAR